MSPQARVLVDSSVWVDALRSRGSISERLGALIEAGEAATTGVVLAEILPFVQPRQARSVAALFGRVPRYEVEPAATAWNRVVEHRRKLRAGGLGDVALADVQIASVAMEHRLSVWSTDRHFPLMAGRLPLALWTP